MKRTFSGQMTAMLAVIFLTLLILSATTLLLNYRSGVNLVQSELTDTVNAESGVLQLLPGSVSRNRQQISNQLNYTARATGKDTVICDENGTVIACSCGLQSCEHLGSIFPNALLELAREDKTGFTSKIRIECYSGKRMAAVKMTTDRDGSVDYLVASVPTDRITGRIANSFRVNLMVIVTVMLLTIPLVWWIIRRQTNPIKLLTAAARKMAHGQMNVRVPTDETDTAELNELAVAFNNMSQALAQSERKRQEFVANVSHELKTPMTTISGYMDGMLDGTIPPSEYPKYMEIISNEVKRLSRLVRSMLEISRIQDKGIPPERKIPFDLCQVVGETLLSFEQKINDKHLEVETNLPEAGAKAIADPDAITQVVYNLIDNAVKFCPEKGTLGLRIREAKRDKYMVSVRNTGPTIPPEELPLVFERFHKTDKSRSADRDGVGLGLYIVKTIILSHEEDIYVTSRDGVTEFTFTMPKAPANG